MSKAAPDKGTVIKDRYRIEKLVGKGGQKRVYLATDLTGQIKEKIALKEMLGSTSVSKEVATMHLFEQEAIILKGLKHVSIPKVFDYFVDQGTFYIIQEYIDGESLSNLLHRHTFSQEEALKLCIQMADVLQYLHRCRPPIIYRDLKPQNVKVHNGRVFLIDFSGALLPGIGDEAERLRVYSRGYTPPDAHRRKTIDYTFDTYSLGVILYEMLTLYDVKSSEGKLPDITKIRPDISPEIREIVNKAVNRSHYWQYQNMWEMKMELINARKSIKKLSQLEERSEKNIFLLLSILVHKFRISLLQPLLALFCFLMIGFMLIYPYLLSPYRQVWEILKNPTIYSVFALYMLFVEVIWGRWFGGTPALARLYKWFHSPVRMLGNLRTITVLLILNFLIVCALSIFYLIIVLKGVK